MLHLVLRLNVRGESSFYRPKLPAGNPIASFVFLFAFTAEIVTIPASKFNDINSTQIHWLFRGKNVNIALPSDSCCPSWFLNFEWNVRILSVRTFGNCFSSWWQVIAMSISTNFISGIYLHNTIEYILLRLDLVRMVRNLDSLPQFQQFQEKVQQVHM